MPCLTPLQDNVCSSVHLYFMHLAPLHAFDATEFCSFAFPYTGGGGSEALWSLHSLSGAQALLHTEWWGLPWGFSSTTNHTRWWGCVCSTSHWPFPKALSPWVFSADYINLASSRSAWDMWKASNSQRPVTLVFIWSVLTTIISCCLCPLSYLTLQLSS